MQVRKSLRFLVPGFLAFALVVSGCSGGDGGGSGGGTGTGSGGGSGSGGSGGGSGGSGGSGGGSGGGSTSTSSKGEQINGSCPSQPSQLTGTKSDGQSCESYTDCAATCCACAKGGNHWLAAACVNGKCSQSGACSATADSSWCQTCEPKGGSCLDDSECCSGTCDTDANTCM